MTDNTNFQLPKDITDKLSPFQKFWNKFIYGWDLNDIATGKLRLVIDTSHWIVVPSKFNEEMFVKKAKELGLVGIIYKISDANKSTGKMFVDDTAEFWFNLIQRLNNEHGMNVTNGGYHWLQQSVDPKVAFNYHHSWVKDHPSRLPFICDFEEPSITSATDFLWRLETWLGEADKYNPNNETSIIYTAMGYISTLKGMIGMDYSKKMSWMQAYTLWLARYSRYYPSKIWPWETDSWKMWQYSAGADWPYYKDGDGIDGLNWGLQAHGIDMNWVKSDYIADYLNIEIEENPADDDDDELIPSESLTEYKEKVLLGIDKAISDLNALKDSLK